MNKNLERVLLVSMLVLTAGVSAFAVWPSDVSLPPNLASSETSNSVPANSTLLSPVLQKLEEDQRRLAAVLEDLRRDQDILRQVTQSSTKAPDDGKMGGH